MWETTIGKYSLQKKVSFFPGNEIFVIFGGRQFAFGKF